MTKSWCIIYFFLLDSYLFYFFFAGIHKSTGIKLLKVEIPPHAIRGQDARLICKYDMEGDKLYSIKWYRNGNEFYRYIPSDTPDTTVFNGNGINVDVSAAYYLPDLWVLVLKISLSIFYFVFLTFFQPPKRLRMSQFICNAKMSKH